MWIQERNGKIRVFERYMDYTRGTTRPFSVTIEKNTSANRKMADQILRQMSEATKPISPDTITFGQLVELYRKDQERSVSAGTHRRNYYACNTFMKLLGKDTRVSQINAQYIRTKLLYSNKEAHTINEHLTRLKALFNWGYKNDYIEDVSFLRKLTTFEDNTRRERLQDKYLEPSELEQVLANTPDIRWNFVIRFMVMTGMRFGEVSALECKDIDLEERYIYVTKGYNSVVNETSTPKTLTSNRDIFIQDELLVLIKEINQFFDMAYPERELFICRDDYGNIDVAAFNKYLKEHNPLDKKITSHIFRHTHTSLMAEAGVPIEVLTRRLGHTDSRITKNIYFHVTEKIKKHDEDLVRNIQLCYQPTTENPTDTDK